MKSNGSSAGPSGYESGEILVGVDIGGTKTAVVLCAKPPEVLWRAEFPTLPESGPQHALDRIQQLIAQGLETHQARPSAIGVSCGGPLDRTQGIIQSPPNLPTWNNVPIKATLESTFSVSCRVENDANAGAVAEHQFGAGSGLQHVIFLTLGTGIGAGLILNGKIFRGTNAMAGEIGHVRLTDEGPSGYGKAGSVEGWASGGGMALHAPEVIRAAIAAGTSTTLASRLDSLTARDIGEALNAGDSVAASIIQRTGEKLGDALAVLVDVLNPQRIIVGGLALRLGEHLLGPARARMIDEALPAAAEVCSVVPAALGERIGDVAAICIAMGLHGD